MSQTQQSTGSSPTVPAPPSIPAASEPARDPYRVLGIIGFVLSFFAFLNLAGLTISIIALVRSKRAGFRNRFALAGTVISSIGVVITIVVTSFAVSTLVGAAQTCARLGDGIHTIGSATYTCTPTSFYVSFSTTSSAPSAGDEQWTTANSLYAEAVCPTNAAREELFDAVDANDFARLVPVAAREDQCRPVVQVGSRQPAQGAVRTCVAGVHDATRDGRPRRPTPSCLSPRCSPG